jgi:uncharacterized protein YkwD
MKRVLLVLVLSVRASASDADEITAEKVVALMNAYRAEASLPPLHIDTSLTVAATARMQEMADGEWWAHESPEGKLPFAYIPIEYDYAFAAENLAAGFDTAPLLVQSWMESPGHRSNIMGVQYADCGVAILEGSTKGPAMGKSVVVLFGRRR